MIFIVILASAFRSSLSRGLKKSTSCPGGSGFNTHCTLPRATNARLQATEMFI